MKPTSRFEKSGRSQSNSAGLRRLFFAIWTDVVGALNVSQTTKVLAGEFREMRKAWRSLAFLSFTVAVAVWLFADAHFGSRHQSEHASNSEDFNRRLNFRDRELSTLRFELQSVRAERDRAHLELAPWKERAKREFPFDDVTAALAKLEAKTDTVLSMFKSSIANPLTETITSAMCTVSIETDGETGDGGVMLSGAYAAFGADGTALLIAQSKDHIMHPDGKFEFIAPASVFDPLIGKPVEMLATAQFIQIGFNQDSLKGSTAVRRGVVVWVINNKVTLRYTIPPQPIVKEAKELRLFIRDLRDGVNQLMDIETKAEPVKR